MVSMVFSNLVEELPAEVWKKHLETDTATTVEILSIRILRLKWVDDEQYNDFVLPDDVTNDVVFARSEVIFHLTKHPIRVP